MDMKNKNFWRSVSKVVRIIVCFCNFKSVVAYGENYGGQIS